MSANAHIAAQLRSAEQVLAHYPGDEPFPVYLKAFFRMNTKFGSRDRKQVSAFCYACQRLGHALPEQTLRERILAGYLLCVEDNAAVMEAVRPEWREPGGKGLEERMAFIAETYPDWSLEDVFPLRESISAGIDADAFVMSHFRQPRLFIRTRPGKRGRITAALEKQGILFETAGPHGLSLGNATQLDVLGAPDRDYVVQDISSQATAGFFPERTQLPARPLVWDACAGSGGKSIMVTDLLPGARLSVTDLRPSILDNLRRRFRFADITAAQMAVMDLTVSPVKTHRDFFPEKGFDFILADVPCTGSGTWGRDPWMLTAFQPDTVESYARRQKAILDHIIPQLRKGGFLLYITCSVYVQENEAVVAHIQAVHHLTSVRQSLLQGYRQQGDSMFAALFRNDS